MQALEVQEHKSDGSVPNSYIKLVAYSVSVISSFILSLYALFKPNDVIFENSYIASPLVDEKE